MARPRKATSQLEVVGAFETHPDRRRSGEPVPIAGDLIKPEFRDNSGASAVWDEIAPILFAMGTAARGDESELATYCTMEAEFRSNPKNFIQKASLVAQKRAYAEKFGVAGAGSRAKLGVTDGGKKDEDPASKYFASAGSSNGLCN